MNQADLEIFRSILRDKDKNYTDWTANTNALLAAHQNGTEWLEIVKDYIRDLYRSNLNRDYIGKFIILVDLVKYIVDELSQVHESPSERVLFDAKGNQVDEGEQFDTWEAILDACHYDDVTKQAEKWANLLNCGIIYLAPDMRHRTFELHMVEAPELTVWQNHVFPNSFNMCETIAIRMASNEDSRLARPSDELYWVFERLESPNPDEPDMIQASLTDGDFVQLRDQPPEMALYSNLDRFPMVLVQPDHSRRGLLFRDIPQDLLTLGLAVPWRMTSRQYAIGLKQFEPYATSTNKDEYELSNAPNASATPATIILGVDNLQTIPWDPKTESYMADLRAILQIFSQARGLNMSFFERLIAPQSGIAKFYDDKPRRERRQDEIPYYQDLEDRQLWPRMLQMAQLVGFPGADKLTGYTQVSKFPDLESELSPQEQQAIDVADIAQGLTSKEEIRAARDGITLDEAVTKLAEIGAKAATTEPQAGGFQFGRRQ